MSRFAEIKEQEAEIEFLKQDIWFSQTEKNKAMGFCASKLQCISLNILQYIKARFVNVLRSD